MNNIIYTTIIQHIYNNNHNPAAGPMEKRIADLADAFEHCRFDQCLRMSQDILKKLNDGKKKVNLSENDLQNLYMIRVGSLGATASLHQANALIKQKFGVVVKNEGLSFLFLQISMLAMDDRLPKFVRELAEVKDRKQANDIGRFVLYAGEYSLLARTFLKKYAISKNIRDSFAQIYLQYLQQLSNRDLINYARNKVFAVQPQLNLKLVSMFLQKFLATLAAEQKPKDKKQLSLLRKTESAAIDLKFRVCFHEGNAEGARRLFVDKHEQIKDNIFVYLRSLIGMPVQKEQNYKLWKSQFLAIFTNNLNMDSYQPVYAFSLQFLSQILTAAGQKVFCITAPSMLQPPQLYQSHEDPLQQLQNYLNSLFTEYSLLKDSSKQHKSKDFYKISLKNCLLLLISTLHRCRLLGQVQHWLIEYKEQYGNKLTFVDEIKQWLASADIFTQQYKEKFCATPSKIANPEDKLIWAINYERLTHADPLKLTLQQNYTNWHRLVQLYHSNRCQVQKNKKLEKGQLYLSDYFITLCADSIRRYCELAPELTPQAQHQLHLWILSTLTECIQRSPHNHQNKLRALYFNSQLHHHEPSYRLLQSLDIKAVQLQTLGYWYLRPLLTHCHWSTHDALLVRITKSYQQNLRQCTQYAYKALLSASIYQCQQNICYQSHIDRSYNYLLLLYVLYLRSRNKDNSGFYLSQIVRRITRHRQQGVKLSFSADFRVMNNMVSMGSVGLEGGDQFVDGYGMWNSYRVLEVVARLHMLVNIFVGKEWTEEQAGECRKAVGKLPAIAQVYNFAEYDIFQRKIHYTYGNGKAQHERSNALQLQMLSKVVDIGLAVCDLVIECRQQTMPNAQAGQTLRASILALTLKLNSLDWRTQICTLPYLRELLADIIAVLTHQSDLIAGKKKKTQAEMAKKQLYQQLAGLLVESVSEGVKLGARSKQEEKKYVDFEAEDEMLHRVTVMTGNQYRKMYKVKY